MRTLSVLFAVYLTACTGPTVEDSGDERIEGSDRTVTPFNEEWIHFGAENKRSVDVTVEFPDLNSTYTEVRGRFQLECPRVDGGCDHWDRYGTLGLVLDAGTEDERVLELDRFITAYRTGFSWESDLTDFRPLLHGEQTLRVFIDTWVTEGHSDGAGWLFTSHLDFVGGPSPSPEPTAVVPLWTHMSYNSGEPAAVAAQFPGHDVTLPAADAYNLRSFISGHGFGGTDNCAEFCALDHTYTVDDLEVTRSVWRDDCGSTVTDSTQLGTWEFNRAGWCPGAQVHPWIQSVSTTGGDLPVHVAYDLEDWTWANDGGQPFYYMSAVLVGYDTTPQ